MSEVYKKSKDLEEKAGSSTFCITKFHYYSVDESRLNSSSCCKIPFEKIKLNEVKESPIHLIHPKQLQADRLAMLQGERPKSCETCWQREAQGQLSRRQLDNAWRYEALIAKNEKDLFDPIQPSVWEYSLLLGNLCNMMCLYCSPRYSSQWESDIRTKGTYLDKRVIDELPSEEDRIAFEEARANSWPEIAKSVTKIMITGGEPFMHPTLWKYLEKIEAIARKDLFVNINTNLNIAPSVIDEWIIYSQRVEPQVNELRIITSLDAVGKKAEIIRHGLDELLFMRNLKRVLEETENVVRVKSVLSILNLADYPNLLIKMASYRKRYGERFNLVVDVIDHPRYLSPFLVPDFVLRAYIDQALAVAGPYGEALTSELTSVKTRSGAEVFDPQTRAALIKDLNTFIETHKSRKGVDLRHAFPHLATLLDTPI